MLQKSSTKSQPIVIDLEGPQGNVFYLMGLASNLSRQLLLDFNKIQKEMMSSDYKNAVQVFEKNFGQYVILITNTPEYYEN